MKYIKYFFYLLKGYLIFKKKVFIGFNSKIIKNKKAKIYLKGRIKIAGNLVSPHSINKTNIQLRKNSKTYLINSSIADGVSLVNNGFFYLGENSFINSNSNVYCNNYIKIGKNCAISFNCQIIDTHFHTLINKEKNKEEKIIIEDNVWVGANTILLKGTHIEEGCVVAAGSILNKKYPKNSLIAGNPAKVVKKNIEWRL